MNVAIEPGLLGVTKTVRNMRLLYDRYFARGLAFALCWSLTVAVNYDSTSGNQVDLQLEAPVALSCVSLRQAIRTLLTSKAALSSLISRRTL